MSEQSKRYKVYERGLLHSYAGTLNSEKPYMETDSLEKAKAAARDFIDFDLQGFIYDTVTGETTDAWDIVDEEESQDTEQASFEEAVTEHGAKLISNDDMLNLINAPDRWTNSDYFGVFACIEPKGNYTVCDNSQGECFVETFETIAGAQAYLRGADPVEALTIDRKASRGEPLPDAATPSRLTFKDRLVVLDTRPGFDGQTDALLYDPGASKDLTPFIIAQGFNAETKGWSSGTYIHDLVQAVSRFRELPDPEWAVAGLTPKQVIDAWGTEFQISDQDATDIARAANNVTSEYMSAETEDVYRLVADTCPRKEVDIPSEKTTNPQHGISLKEEAESMRAAATHLSDGPESGWDDLNR